ncbi:MAG TPA: hypothetical protein VMW10_01555 [Alphaproteobacteria bacterium]|nr:hypothetical protein [Alphaproteobacteria bacterium]
MSKWINRFLKKEFQNGTDNTDKPHGEGHLSVLSVLSGGPFSESSLLDDFEERIAIAEYDGRQTTTQALRIAYQDAFAAVLNTLPYEENYGNNWLEQRIKAAQSWLTAQGLQQPE